MIFYDDIASNIPVCSLDKGIVDLVGLLNGKGITTYLSCDGHGDDNAWVILEAAHFNGYIKSKRLKMVNFLNTGEARWKLQLNYFGQSKFSGLGSNRPRKKKLKRIIELEMTAIIVLDGPAKIAGKKTSNMLALERAVKKFL